MVADVCIPAFAGMMGSGAYRGRFSKFVFLAKIAAPRECGVGEPSPPPEIMYESPPADPISHYGLTGVGLIFVVLADIGT